LLSNNHVYEFNQKLQNDKTTVPLIHQKVLFETSAKTNVYSKISVF